MPLKKAKRTLKNPRPQNVGDGAGPTESEPFDVDGELELEEDAEGDADTLEYEPVPVMSEPFPSIFEQRTVVPEPVSAPVEVEAPKQPEPFSVSMDPTPKLLEPVLREPATVLPDYSLDLSKKTAKGEETVMTPAFSTDRSAVDETQRTKIVDPEPREYARSDSSEEMSNFFTATRPGFKKAAGEVKRVTRLDFEDYHRRRHLESFAKSMDQWREFEKKFEGKDGATPQDFTFSRLNFDRYRDTLLTVDPKNMTKLDAFILDLIESFYDEMQNEDLNVVMSRLRKKHKLAPSKREIFERLEAMQCATTDAPEGSRQARPEPAEVDDIVHCVSDEPENEEVQQVMVGSKLKHLLRNKAIRSNSGVVVITVMTSPGAFSCSEDCHYCPNEPGQPRSYLSTEPAVLRANQNDFDAVKQFYDRANTLYKNGHVVDKIEIIVLGGTWSGYPKDYQEEFIRDLFYAANVYPETLSTCRERGSLEHEHQLNELGKCRIIGLTLETRPDRITPAEIEQLRRYGCTRVQLGVQHTKDAVLEHVNRGHSTRDSVRAVFLLKENCFKVDIHLMPDLPSSDPEQDLEMFRYVLASEDLQADQWKIYPCEVTPFSEIEKWHKEGRYVPYFDVDSTLLTTLLIRVKRAIHPWIRLNRVIRDIPNPSIIAGTNFTNLRQLLLDRMRKMGLRCNCVRCREVGSAGLGAPELVVRQYATRGGTEYFLSYEDASRSTIYGFLRLRVSDRRGFDESVSRFRCLANAGLIRELHVYGVVVAHGEKLDVDEPSQHRGIGTNLITAAEILTAYRGLWKMAVIAGIGTREYYRKHGYELEETFMTKQLRYEDMRARFESAQARQIKVPARITIEAVNLENAAIVLAQPLPEIEQMLEYKLREHGRHSIEVGRFLQAVRGSERQPIDYLRKGLVREMLLNARGLGEEALEFAKQAGREFATEHPFVTVSLSFCALALLFARGARGRR